MTQDRSFAAGQYRGHPPALVAEVPVADRVDAAVDAMKPTGPDRRQIPEGSSPAAMSCWKEMTPCCRVAIWATT
jgi:hypothetical protein